MPTLAVVNDSFTTDKQCDAHPSDTEVSPSADIDWAILMGRAQSGDGTAYRRLLLDIAPYLRSIVRRSRCDRNDIEDVVQDILLTVHSIRYTYDPTRPFAPWLVAVANRRIIDRLRRQGRLRSRETELTHEHEFDQALGRKAEDAIANTSLLTAALDQLPASQRQAIELLRLKEKSLKEVSQESGININTLKVTLHRALKNLRKLIDDFEQAE